MAETNETEQKRPDTRTDAYRAERREGLEAERAGKKRVQPPKHPEPSSFDADALTTPSGKRITVTDQQFAVMLEKAGGFRSRVAKQLGISTSAVTHRIKRSKYLTEMCKDVDETVLDLAEAQLIKAAQNGEPWAITFILKCKGRKRGWIERQDIAFGGDADALPPPIVLSVHDAAFVEAERERQKREFAEVVDAAVIELKPDTAADGGEKAETWGATAQPSDAGTGNGTTVAPTDGGTGAESPETGAEAAVSRPAERGASAQGDADGAPRGAEIAPVAAEPPKPETPPPRVPRTPSEAAAMRRAGAERQRAANGNAQGNAQGGAGGRPKPRFFAFRPRFREGEFDWSGGILMESTNKVVQNALNAWHGNPYKCPFCGSTNGWTYDGHCKSKRCGRKLPPQQYAERINEVVRRKIVNPNNPQDLKNIASLTGVPVDILRGKLGRGKMMEHGQGALKLRQKHSDLQGRGTGVEKFRRRDTQGLGFTLAKGRVAPTTERSLVGGKIDPNRDAIIHKGYVGYLDKSRDGRYSLTSHYKSGADFVKEERIRKR